MTLKSVIPSILAALLALAAIPGCADDAAVREPDAVLEPDEEATTSEDELRTNAQKLVGSFHGGEGAIAPPRIKGIVFKEGNTSEDGTYFADFDTGMRCASRPGPGAGCTPWVRLEGTYKATANYVRLLPKPGAAHSFYGRYRYKLVGSKLTLTRSDFSSTWYNGLSKELSYCFSENDCGDQITSVRCRGIWTCDGVGAQSCVFLCQR